MNLDRRVPFICQSVLLAVLLAIFVCLRAVPVDAQPVPRALSERMAGFDQIIVRTNEQNAISNVLAYPATEGGYMGLLMLSQLVPWVQVNGQWVGPTKAENLSVEDIPGGTRAQYTIQGVKVTTELTPLIVGRETTAHDGAALYRIATQPASPVFVNCNAPIKETSTTVELAGPAALLAYDKQIYPVALTSTGERSVEEDEKGEAFLKYTFAGGAGDVLVAFAEKRDEALRLAALNPVDGRKTVDAYYAKLLESRIETPEKNLNEAFSGAIRTLEYNYVKPLGWNECIHHWEALWHMQHTAGAEWLGQTDRSRDCTLTHADHLMPGGAVPQLFPNDKGVHRDFGGSNQYWFWQARHYWHFTGDKEFARKIAPAMDTVLQQTFEENDPDHDGLLAWGLQIGNQEDFVANPHNGTSPTIEGINMMLARAEIARALDDPKTAELWEGRASATRALLRDKLWLKDLGRYAYFIDPTGSIRLEGQYHTLLYPAIWGITDLFDSYTTVRHVRDRLMGVGGEVYCSANFPYHCVGTWGMQAGAAQQPWAAWAFSATGLRNETWHPLKAVSEWVMDVNHRGSWPEISIEGTPAYFTPPAGLFVAAVAEALYGLHVDKPAGTLTISPSFPDAWPAAKLNLPEYKADYKRDGNRLTYTVESRDPLKRVLRWSLPPFASVKATVDGQPLACKVEPGVNQMIVTAEAPAATRSTFTLEYNTIDISFIGTPSAVAEGEPFKVREVRGQTIYQVIDRGGVLADWRKDGEAGVAGAIARGLLAPYQSYGRLGDMTFARRTLFLECAPPAHPELRYYFPFDLTILPRFEVAPAGEVIADDNGVKVGLLVRNNTSSPLRGTGWLRAARGAFPLTLDVAPHAETTCTLTLPRDRAALLSPGDNRASMSLTNTATGESAQLPVTLTVRQPFEKIEPLKQYAAARLVGLPLPAEQFIDDTRWAELRKTRTYPALPWPGWQQPMEGLKGKTEIAVPEVPGLKFTFPERKFLPIGAKVDRPSFKLKVPAGNYKKFYLLVMTFVDNHESFATIGHVTVNSPTDVVYGRTLHFPGDLDWWDNQGMDKMMDTAQQSRADRLGLLPLLHAEQSDWKEGQPPAFPQPKYWANSLLVRTPTSNLNVIEVDLGQATPVESLTLETVGVDPAFGLLGVVAERAGQMEKLDGTPWMPPAGLHDPRALFVFDKPGDLKGWRLEGNAFSVTSHAGMFDNPTLNSLVSAGEPATGKAISPEFRVQPREEQLEIEYQGGHSTKVDGKENLCVNLVDATTSEVLRSINPPGSHVLTTAKIALKGLEGRTVRLMLVDENTNSSYAWIGLRSAGIK